MKSIAIYARVSSDRQAKQATIESQLAALKEQASSDGHSLLPDDICIDDGYSGATIVRASTNHSWRSGLEKACTCHY